MSTSLPNLDNDGKEIEVGSLIRYWRSQGWDGGRNTLGVVTEIKPKTYLVREVTEMPAEVDGERVEYLVYADWRSPEPHRVAKEFQQRWGVRRPAMVHSAAEMEGVWARTEEIKARLATERDEREARQQAQREADQAAEAKRRDINDAINAAVETLKEQHREEFERLVTVGYRQRGVTPSDLDDADTYYDRAYTVRPEGYSKASV